MGCCSDGFLGNNGSGVDTNTTYEFTQVVNPDGSITHTVTGSDGSTYEFDTCCDVPDIFLTDVSTGEPDENGNVTITYTMSDGTTHTAVVPEPADVYVNSFTTTGPTDNGDGTADVCHIVTLTDGTVIGPVCHTIILDTDTDTFIIPTGIDLDCDADTLTLSYLDQNGAPQTVVQTGVGIPCTDTNTTNVSIVWDPATGVLTLTDSDGNTVTTTIGASDLDVSDNGDGTSTVTHTAADGTVTAFNVCNTCGATSSFEFTVNPDGSITISHDDGNGTVTGGTIPAPLASNTSTVTGPTDNGDGTSTYVHDDGNGTTTDITVCTDCEHTTLTSFTATDNGDATYDITVLLSDGSTGTVTIDVNEVDFDITDVTQVGSVLTFTNELGNVVNVDICATVAANCNATYVINADGSATYTDNAGNTVTIPAPAPEVGQAVVTDNGDNTTTVTGTDTNGAVTTDDVINNLLLNTGTGGSGSSRDIVPATDILLHDGNVYPGTVDNSPAAANGPFDRDTCFTQIHKNSAGQLTGPPEHDSYFGFEANNYGNPAADADFAAWGDETAAGWQVIKTWTGTPWCNPDPCRTITMLTQVHFNSMFEIVTPDGTGALLEIRYDGARAAVHSARNLPGDPGYNPNGRLENWASGATLSRIVILAPGDCYTPTIDYRIVYTAGAGGPVTSYPTVWPSYSLRYIGSTNG